MTMITLLVMNVVLYFGLPMVMDAHAAHSALSWWFIGEFIFTLAMALKCYPLQSGGLLAIQIVVLGLTSAKNAYNEVAQNLEVVLLLVFMVAGIYFMKPLLMFIFSKSCPLSTVLPIYIPTCDACDGIFSIHQCPYFFTFSSQGLKGIQKMESQSW